MEGRLSTKDKRSYEKTKSDPARYAEYLERKRRERVARGPRTDYDRERMRRWRAANPEMANKIRQAGHAVESAVKGRKLYKRRSCQQCGAIGKVEAHHYLGYEKEHWLDVQWLCQLCHAKCRQPLTNKGDT